LALTHLSRHRVQPPPPRAKIDESSRFRDASYAPIVSRVHSNVGDVYDAKAVRLSLVVRLQLNNHLACREMVVSR
jgi:hypothetical protein